jgi:CRP-like cAMP-binding protein
MAQARQLIANFAILSAFALPSSYAGGRDETMEGERRNIKGRAAIVQRVIEGVVQNPSVTLTVNSLQSWLGVPFEAAQRILSRLASSGLVREVQRGVWARGTWPGAQREWY